MFKRTLKIVGWLLGSVFGLAIVAYGALFAANLKDQPPAPEIAVLKSHLDLTSPVESEQNSYLFMLGFAAPDDTDPISLGKKQYEWMKSAGPEYKSQDPVGVKRDYRALRSKPVEELGQACANAAKAAVDCFALLEDQNSALEQWLSDELWLLERYQSLLTLGDFQEVVPFDFLAPLPSYSVVFDGQSLHLLNAWLAARRGDAAEVNAALQADLMYWRLVLKRSNALITKMIAVSAIVRHFKFGNEVLRNLPQQAALDGIPSEWGREFSDEERSMKRSLAGEWMFFENLISMYSNPDHWQLVTESTDWDRFGWSLFEPFWQRQDVSNRYATYMLDLGNILDVPYTEADSMVQKAEDLGSNVFRRFSRLYNFTGDLVMGHEQSNFSSFALRVWDLEGVRRVALVVAQVRAEGATKREAPFQVFNSELVNPYDEEPFTWQDDMVVFFGRAPNDRSTHEFAY
ncbi:MAG: hypothetical protein AAF385_07990 [Pseudomonadota bacterium]